MKFILKNVLKVIGAKKLMLMAWDLVKPELELLAKKSETEIDDKAIIVIDGIIKEVLGAKELSEYLADTSFHRTEKSNLVV